MWNFVKTEGIIVLPDRCDWENVWKNEEIAKVNKRKDAGFSKSVKGKVHPCIGTETLYRSYGP
jgi:hypothetical protein